MLLNVCYVVYCVVFYAMSFLPCVCIFLVVHVGEFLPSILERGQLRFRFSKKYLRVGLHASVKNG